MAVWKKPSLVNYDESLFVCTDHNRRQHLLCEILYSLQKHGMSACVNSINTTRKNQSSSFRLLDNKRVYFVVSLHPSGINVSLGFLYENQRQCRMQVIGVWE